MFKKLFSVSLFALLGLSLSAQLIINELNQGTGDAEYVELVVVGTKTCTDSTANIQGWILDDNCGFFGSDGIAGGHIRFSTHAQWAAVPYGTIIVVYNGANIYTSTPPNSSIIIDETDANNDGVYYLPSSSSYFETNTNLPIGGTVITTYTTSGYTAGGGAWDMLGMRNAGDAFQVVKPTVLNAAYHSVGWGNLTGMDIAFAGSASGLLFQNSNLVTNDPYTQANWESAGQSSGTPGTPNNAANLAWINAMRAPFDASGSNSTINQTICDGDTFVFNGQNLTTLGVYIDTFTTASGCDSIITLNLNVVICNECNMDLGNDTLICGPVNYLLDAGPFDQYLWQDGSTNQTFTATNTGTFWCEASNFDSTNLIVNPGFESGNVNFTTNYVVGTGGTWGLLSNAGTYGISTSPSLLHTSFQACSDHTSGTGNMMVVNGSNTANQAVWCQTITVSPNTDYYFSIWAASLENTNASNVASLFFKVNGVQIGTNFNPSFTACTWQQYNQTWNSGTNTSVDLCIFNHTITGNNDFAIDDIFFGELCTISDTIVISGTPSQVVQNSLNICFGDSVEIFGQFQSVAGVYNDTIISSLGCDSLYLQTTLSVADSLFSNATLSICATDSAFLENAWQNTSGVYVDSFQTASSCDSLVFTTLNIYAAATMDTTILCTNDAANVGTILFNTIQNGAGCDSIFYYQTTVLTILDSIVNVSCTNIASQAVNTIDTLINTLGCDSFYQLNNVIYILPDTTYLPAICSNNVAQPTTNYTHTLSLYGCDSFTVAQVINPLPIVIVGQDTTINAGQNVVLQATGATDYTWNTGDVGNYIDVSPIQTTTYSVMGIDLNNCQDYDSITVFVILDEVKIFVPTAFSPNGDGLNDSFRIVNEDEFENISMKVYNRWGELVYTNTNTNAAWDGTYKNVAQPVENYIYYIQAKAKKNQQMFNISGSLSLIR